MSTYKLTNNLTKLAETACILYAVPGGGAVEISDAQKEDSGFTLCEGHPFPFAATAIYARAVGGSAVLNAVPGKVPT